MVEITQHGDFQVATRPAGLRFVAWAKMGRIVAKNPVSEPGEHVWFESGTTRESAKNAILEELGLRSQNAY